MTEGGTGAGASLAADFEPPRARRGARLSRAWYALRRRVCWRPEQPAELVFDSLVAVAVVCVPGLGFRLCGYHRRALACAGFVVLCVVGCLAFLGRPASMLLGGLIAGVHAMGVVAYFRACNPQAGRWRLAGLQAGWTLVFLMTVTPTLRALVSPWVLEVTDGRRVVLCRTKMVGAEPKEGDIVAAQLGSDRTLYGYGVQVVGEHATVSPGCYLVRVVALGRADLRVEPKGGVALLGQPVLEVEDSPRGGVGIPEGSVLVWPVTFNLPGGREIPAELKSFVLARERLLGRPYHRWFWRNLDDESL